jgi:hypothetical protein
MYVYVYQKEGFSFFKLFYLLVSRILERDSCIYGCVCKDFLGVFLGRKTRPLYLAWGHELNKSSISSVFSDSFRNDFLLPKVILPVI